MAHSLQLQQLGPLAKRVEGSLLVHKPIHSVQPQQCG